MARLCNSQGLMRTGILVGTLVGVLALSLLPVACRQTKSHASAANIDSNSLKQTAVIATLDCPLPEHKNAIWCSTFQMAWDKLKQDIIGEPVQVLGAEELANRLNRAPFPTGNIEEKSYYVTAGFVKSGIIEQIQKDMKRRFPSEPVPAFDSRYRTLPDVILAYAYLNIDVGFQHPYYIYGNGFGFLDSNTVWNNVTAFCATTSGRTSDEKSVRDQVEILYYDDGQASGTAHFAVDLSKQTQPYQVILACMPRRNTLGEAAKTLQDKIATFKNNSDYEVLRRLQPGDTLVVPDVLYKLTHHFNELLGKHLGNQKWGDYFLFEAMQRIDFTLSRTGVVLKSEARVPPARSARTRKEWQLHFDRPFLICVQKREPNATPFFLMWVDNAELMQKYADQSSR